MKIIRMQYITRKYVQDHRDMLFLFGDNLERQGMGGQAKEMRGESNTQGIPTKVKPTMEPDAFFNDDMFDVIKEAYDDLFMIIIAAFKAGEFNAIVIPADGLGTGLAQLPAKAPRIYDYLNQKINELELI